MTDDMDARARGKRLEAECERMQRELSDARFLAQNFQKRWGNLCDQLVQCEGWTIEAVEQASSKGLPEGAPPPEGEPELLTGHGDQRPKRGGWAPGFYANTCQSCGRSFVGDKRAWTCADCAYADTSSEQAHGDALAGVLSDDGKRFSDWLVTDVVAEYTNFTGKKPDWTGMMIALGEVAPYFRQALTASGMPYVPEEVRRLPEKMRTMASGFEHEKSTRWLMAQAAQLRYDADMIESALASAPAVCEWIQPAWRPIDTYPKDQGVYRNGARVWLWHEDLGVCWGFMDDLPSGFRCDLFQERRGTWEVVAAGVKAARKVHYWMWPAPAIPEPPIAAAPTDGRE